MKTLKTLMTAVIVGGTLGLIAGPALSQRQPAPGDVGHGPPEMTPAGEATIPPEAGFWGHYGMSEQEIEQVHQALRAKGYEPGESPTVTDRKTREAILAFQRDHQLPMTGTLDERTAALLGVTVAAAPGVAPDARVEPRAAEPRAAAPATPGARVEPRPGERFDLTKEDIEHVQQVLRARGYKPGTELSLTDKQTMEAIRDFQRDNNLPITGTIDQKTAALLGVGPFAAAGAPDRPEKIRPGGDDPPPGAEWWGHHGMTEQEVQQVQQALRAKGYEPGNVAVATDPKTREAIRDFQRDNNLPITGTLDERTAALLGIPYNAPQMPVTPGTR